MATDSRPRLPYRLHDGSDFMLILDHGETPPDTTTFQQANGSIVVASRVLDCDVCGGDGLAFKQDDFADCTRCDGTGETA